MNERKLWDRVVKQARQEPPAPMEGHRVRFPRPVNELTDDRPAIRQALRESRMQRGVRVRTNLPYA